ncbi:hypothetical protein PWP93_13370 [Paraburkholderia sp. A1RI-2L]|uniref:hypothetical protein n=1 Tax=Paraburkholderia sp. A1RI-2L TaxID=3028367 RepID=UPI003B7DD12C
MTTTVSFEPLFPEDRVLDPLLDQASDLVGSSERLLPVLRTPFSEALAPQLRAMNSYYTNKIEGQHTTPARIEDALKENYSTDSVERKKQHLALAHIATETVLEHDWATLPVAALFEPERVTTLHERFFSALPADERFTSEGAPIVPGELRNVDVTAELLFHNYLLTCGERRLST